MSATTCASPGLLEDYVEQQLNQGDRQRLEAHLALCPRCAEELRGQLDLEHRMRQALGCSVQSLYLAPEASARIVRAAQGNARRGMWTHHLVSAGQVVASATVVILLLAGLIFSLGYLRPSWAEKLAILLPDLVAPDGTQSENLPALPEISSQMESEATTDGPQASFRPLLPVLSVRESSQTVAEPGETWLLIEPEQLRPGETFTATLSVHNEQDQPLIVSRVDLEIEGPANRYHFVLAVQDPLPPGHVSALSISSDSLAEASQELYQISPAEILDRPGTYTIRLTLFGHVTAPER